MSDKATERQWLRDGVTVYRLFIPPNPSYAQGIPQEINEHYFHVSSQKNHREAEATAEKAKSALNSHDIAVKLAEAVLKTPDKLHKLEYRARIKRLANEFLEKAEVE